MLEAVQIAIVLGALVVGWFVKSFFPSYMTEKGKNLATKEDVREITEKIESVKATLGAKLHIHQVRYENEFKLLLELTEKLVKTRDAAMGLRPEASYEDIKEPEVKQRRMTSYMEAARELYTFVETRQPFFPEDIYAALKVLDQAAWREFVQFKHQQPDVASYWENALKNGAEISQIASAVLILIRQRVRVWEKFD